MPNDLTPVWSQVEQLIDEGFSLIAVRDKSEGKFFAKTPFGSWKAAQTERADRTKLWDSLERNKTSAVAIVAGAISGNLEVIDIDVKYLPGIDGKLFVALDALFPDLFSKLRIHKTPSGGYHILYRVQDGVIPGNCKLAGRILEEKRVDYIETRGEGGYILAPPSMNYSIERDNEVPKISWSEREAIHAVCKSFCQIPIKAIEEKVSKHDSGYYSTNPFEHYNKSAEASQLLAKHGWVVSKDSNDFCWYARPDGNPRHVHASYNKEKAIFHIFTSKSKLETRAYNPSTIRGILEFNGNFSELYKCLVGEGYGVLSKQAVNSLTTRRAFDNLPLPNNLTPEDRANIEAKRVEISEKYPHGIFWMESDKDQEDTGFKIQRELFIRSAESMGFRKWKTGTVLIDRGFIYEYDDNDFYNYMKAYSGDNIKVLDALESFYQKSGKFTISRLSIFDRKLLMSNGRDVAYKFYLDYYVKITAQATTVHLYSEATGLIWASSIRRRKFNIKYGGRYCDFLEKAVVGGLTDHFYSVLGYLSHEYKDESQGYITVLTEECPTPEDGGGSGKNLFMNLIKHTTTYMSKAGSQFKVDEKSFQSWKGQRVFAISDVEKGFDLSPLKELSSGNATVKKLYENEVEVDPTEMPKLVVLTNFSYEVSDGGLRRRVIPIEFTNFFTNSGGVKKYYGAFFPDDWTEEDWAGYDYVILKSITFWLRRQELVGTALTGTGKTKQMHVNYGEVLMRFIEENFGGWVKVGEVTDEDFKAQVNAFWLAEGAQRFIPSSAKINKAIKEFGETQGILYDSRHTIRVAMTVKRGRKFYLKAPF